MELSQSLDAPAAELSLGALCYGGENGALRLRVRLTDAAGAPADLTGCSCAAYQIRADRTTLRWSGVIGAGTATVAFPQEAGAVPGRFRLSLLLTDAGGIQRVIAAGTGVAVPTAGDEVMTAGDPVPDLEALLARLAEMAAATQAANAAAQSVSAAVQSMESRLSAQDGRLDGFADDLSDLSDSLGTLSATLDGAEELLQLQAAQITALDSLKLARPQHPAGYPLSGEAGELLASDGAGGSRWVNDRVLAADLPAFEASGASVTVWPSAGLPYRAVSRFSPAQSGAPAPDAPAPVTGLTGLSLTLDDGENPTVHTAAFDGEVPGGELDWGSGLLTPGWASLVLDGSADENWGINSSQGLTVRGTCLDALPAVAAADRTQFFCDRLSNYSRDGNRPAEVQLRVYPMTTKLLRLEHFAAVTGISTEAEARAWLQAHPLTLVYPLPEAARTPVPAGPAVPLRGGPGAQTLSASAGTLTVSGPASLRHLLEAGA